MVKAGKELHHQPADELHRAHREPLEGPHEQRQLRVVFGKALVLLLQPLRAEDYQDYQSVTNGTKLSPAFGEFPLKSAI